MTTIVTRSGKGSSLSWSEVDTNFNNLNTDKIETSALGVTVQEFSANLDTFSTVAPTAAGLALLDDADATAQRNTLGLNNVDNTSDATKNAATATLTNKTIAASTNTVEAMSGPNNSPLSFRNKLINGEVTRINQRNFDGNWAPKGIYPPAGTIAQKESTYGYDQWAKADATNMLQVIEAGNFRPSTVHTLSGQNVTTQQLTSPASGNWTITVPQTAQNVQLEEGTEATPFEIRPIAFELAQCQRYYEELSASWIFYTLGGAGFGSPVNFVVQKYQTPALVWGAVTTTNVTNATVGSAPQTTRGIANSATATATGVVVHSGTCKASAVM